MKNYTIYLLISFVILISCNQNKPPAVSYRDWRYDQQNNDSYDNNLRKSYVLSDRLFIEEYNTDGGAGFTRMVTVYLTDSAIFKEVIANFDENMSYNVMYDSVKRCVIGIGLEYKTKEDSILEVDTINLNKYQLSNEKKSVFVSPPIIGKKFECDNPELKNKFEVYNSTTPKGFLLIEEDYLCQGSYLRTHYLNNERGGRILLRISENDIYFPYKFENFNDSLLLLKKVQSYDVYDTLYVNTLYLDSLIKD